MFSNRKLVLPYIAPYLAYVFIASALQDYVSIEVNYALRIVVCTMLLIWAWKWYVSLKGPHSVVGSIFYGFLAGILGLFLWILFLTPFVDPQASEPWSSNSIGLRMVAAGCLVPVFEELLMRGFVLRFAYQWLEARKNHQDALHYSLDQQSIDTVLPGSWSWGAVGISAVVFAMGHHHVEWPAAIVFSLLMSFLWVWRKDLLVCIVAHSVTNITLALYVVLTGSWHLW